MGPWYNAPMEHPQEHRDKKVFWYTCFALAFVLLTTSLMNVVVFPRFDAVFTYARDLSVLANSLALVAIGVVAAVRPALMHVRVMNLVAMVCLGVGALLLAPSLYAQSAVGVTVAASLAAVGRSWVVIVVGMAASRFELRQIGLCIALAFVVFYVMTAMIWVVPIFVGTLLFFVLPFASLGLTWNQARPVLEAAEGGRAPLDLSITQPASFLPFGSQLFVCLFLFRVAFGYSLRFGEVGGVPLSDFLVIVPVAVVVVWMAVSRKALPADLLVQVSVLFVVAGFFAGTMSEQVAPLASVTLLSAGNTLFDMVAWVALVAVAARNARGAVAAFAWGRGLTGMGTIVGAGLGVVANGLVGGNTLPIELISGSLILVFVGYALIGMRSFSFAKTIEGVEPVVEAVVKSPEQEFDERCRAVAERFRLSPRELEVFMMLARGRDRTYIQERLVVSRNTVKAHVKHVYAKLDIHTHQELIDLVEGEIPKGSVEG